MNEAVVDFVLKELESFDMASLKPTARVGKITSLVSGCKIKESEVIPTVQEVYIRWHESIGLDKNKARQSWVTASGGDFEAFVRNHINEVLNDSGIIAIKGDTLKKLAKTNKKIEDIVEFLMLPNKRRCTQTVLKIWADSDVIVLTKNSEGGWKVLAVISCKTSDHSRNTSVLFWSMVFVHLGIKYYLATQDLDNQFNEECLRAKKKQRRLFEAYCDRVFSTNPSTKYCSQVKSLIVRNDSSSDLTNELLENANRQGFKTDQPLTTASLLKTS